jgi:ABC-type Zn uptake system ZnuABC Zn-binding protein ZnuA
MFKKPGKFKRPVLVSGLLIIILSLALIYLSSACSTNQPRQDRFLKVLAVESFLTDIAKNIAGSRIEIETLIPLGLDPHSFEPSPGDVAKISESDILITNGSGFEEWLKDIITGSNEKIIIIECSKGLKNRIQSEDGQEQGPIEIVQDTIEENVSGHLYDGDPHFWLDPNLVLVYVQNIRDALIEADFQGKDLYNKNAEEYSAKLIELDAWIAEEVKKIPTDRRLLVTNHESFGYYADRYGFKVIGTVIPNFSSSSSPSAKEVSGLIEKIKTANVKAIFLETGSDPKIADQIAKETGINVVTELFTHSLTEPGGPAPTYLEMMKFDTKTIVDSLTSG